MMEEPSTKSIKTTSNESLDNQREIPSIDLIFDDNPSANNDQDRRKSIIPLSQMPGHDDPSDSAQSQPVIRPRVSQSRCRSTAAKAARNKKRHDKLKQKRLQHRVRRRVHPSWFTRDIKQFLKTSNIPFGRINSRHNNILTILYTREAEKTIAESLLPPDIFAEQRSLP